MERVTLGDIADRTGLSKAAVSQILRGIGRFSDETCKRVRDVAEALHYQPDPALSALCTHRRQKRLESPTSHQSIAYLTQRDSRHEWKRFRTALEFYDGAREQAEKYGYKFEHFWAYDFRSMEHLRKVFLNRGIRGVLISPYIKENGFSDFNFTGISAVLLATNFAGVPLHRAQANYFDAMRLLYQKLIGRGYRRIGLILENSTDWNTNRFWSSALLLEQELNSRNGAARLPICREVNREGVKAWVDAHQPDAVISVKNLLALLESLGARVPEDLGYARLGVKAGKSHLTGMIHPAGEVGSAAVDILHKMICSNETGIPALPKLVLLPNSWNEGKTIRPLAKNRTDSTRAEDQLENIVDASDRYPG